jgi:hypothetical protein
MNNILKKYNLLNQDEIQYLNELSANFVIHQSDIYNQTRIDYSKLKSYRNKVTQFVLSNFEDEYSVKAIELNRITEHDFTMNAFHNDHSDLTFVTYFNIDFEGGDFEYIDLNNNNNVFIKPEINLTLIMDKNPLHRVNMVTRGERFSLVVFLVVNPKNQKLLKSLI